MTYQKAILCAFKIVGRCLTIIAICYDIGAANSNDSLFTACKNCKPSAVDVSLKNGAEINTLDESGMTPLMIASSNGCLPVVELLYNRGAEIDLKDSKNGKTALMLAAKKEHINIVQLILNKGANVNIKDKIGDNVLPVAAQTGNLVLVRNSG
jgi:ankyrin repeat protein